MKKIVLIGLILECAMAFASPIGNHMADFLGKQGLLVNSTAPSVHKDQSAGYLSLGGLNLNGASRNVNLVAAQAPGYELGCQKIRLHGGAISFISSKELVRSLRNIGGGMASYSAMILLDTLCPVCKKTVDQLNRMAQEVNGWSQNECLMSAQLTGALWPKSTQSQQVLCEHLALNGGVVSDYAAGRQDCADYKKKTDLMNRAKKASDVSPGSRSEEDKKWALFGNQELNEGNVVWRILSQPGFLSTELNTKEMKEFIMTLTGSFILTPSGETNTLQSMAGKKDFEKALLYGGSENKADIWVCDNPSSQFGCTNPVLTPTEIKDDRTFAHKINKQLEGIQNKLIKGEALDATEQDLINRTQLLPIESILNIQGAYSSAPSILPLHKISDLIAADILASYLTDLVEVVEVGMSKIDMENDTKNMLIRNITVAKKRLRVSMDDRYQQTQLMISIAERTEKIKQKINSGFSSRMQQVISRQNG